MLIKPRPYELVGEDNQLKLDGYLLNADNNVLSKKIDSSNNGSLSVVASSVTDEKVVKNLVGNNNSDLFNLIISIDLINGVCLTLIIILFFMILFKFYLKEEQIKINLSSLIGVDLNERFNYYIIKLIQLNKKTSNIYNIDFIINRFIL
uniref:hypothetical protein 11 n=1 Tax=Moniliophthora perniciosa TaxID=153609 RepID=UPI0000242344|nr:hypothetical protein 11 [Moniliophthora perniciosa]AAQ74301.1 hypothetical protein 11 [Moniliophthora perniciosa]